MFRSPSVHPSQCVPVAFFCGHFPDQLFLLAVLQRRSGFAFLVGVGEDAVQCHLREHYHASSLYRFLLSSEMPFSYL